MSSTMKTLEHIDPAYNSPRGRTATEATEAAQSTEAAGAVEAAEAAQAAQVAEGRMVCRADVSLPADGQMIARRFPPPWSVVHSPKARRVSVRV